MSKKKINALPTHVNSKNTEKMLTSNPKLI